MAVPTVRVYIRQCRRIWRKVRATLVRSSQQTQLRANRRRRAAPAYVVGQRVWLSTKDLPPQRDSKKLAPRYVGPFEIVRVVNPVAVRLRLPASMKVHLTFYVSRIKPVAESDRGWQYLVDWQGYLPEDRSWIPRHQILDPTLLRDFYRAHPEKPGRALGDAPRGGGDFGGRSGTLTRPGHERSLRGTGRRETPADNNQELAGVHKAVPEQRPAVTSFPHFRTTHCGNDTKTKPPSKDRSPQSELTLHCVFSHQATSTARGLLFCPSQGSRRRSSAQTTPGRPPR